MTILLKDAKKREQKPNPMSERLIAQSTFTFRLALQNHPAFFCRGEMNFWLIFYVHQLFCFIPRIVLSGRPRRPKVNQGNIQFTFFSKKKEKKWPRQKWGFPAADKPSWLSNTQLPGSTPLLNPAMTASCRTLSRIFFASARQRWCKKLSEARMSRQ